MTLLLLLITYCYRHIDTLNEWDVYYGIAKLQSVWSLFLAHSPTVTFSRETVSVSPDNKMAAEDLETESYEQVEPPNILPLAPKQANPHNVDSAHCSHGTNSTSSKDKAQPKSHSHAQSKAQQKRHPPPAADSLEEIYATVHAKTRHKSAKYFSRFHRIPRFLPFAVLVQNLVRMTRSILEV